MGKASRRRREQRAEAAKRAQAPAQRRVPLVALWGATGAVALVAVLIVVVLLATRTSPKPPPPAAKKATTGAPAALVAAAKQVGFRPNVEPGVGLVESQPASAAQPSSNTTLLPVSSKASNFTLRNTLGKNVSLSGYRGKAVLLEFFATWCPHCAAEAPHISKIFSSLPAKKYAWVSVNADGETAPSLYAYDNYFGLEPSLLDPSLHAGNFHQPGAAGPVTQRYRVQAFPTLYVLDPQGRITWRSDGEQPDALLRQELHRAAGA